MGCQHVASGCAKSFSLQFCFVGARYIVPLLAVERYRKGEASLGKAAKLAGLPVGQTMTILAEFGVESRIEKEDYLQGLHNLAKVW